MKTFILSILLLSATLAVQAQTMRYFEFTPSCSGHGKWQDSSYLAATSDPLVINDIMIELGKPKDERKFAAGRIDYGHGGYNHNASHWFKWHYIPNQWHLAEVAMEVCDGCPYSDLDADTAYWVRNIQQYCSWGGVPAREVPKPTAIKEGQPDIDISFYPNPAYDKISFTGNTDRVQVSIFSNTGQQLITQTLSGQVPTVNVSELSTGFYFLKLDTSNGTTVRKLMIQK